jgi:UDP-N-acetylmuramoyl-L-alanyl-D-glutamate--2,6-diaminopimelate ligase
MSEFNATAEGVSLVHVLAGAEIRGADDIIARSCSADSRHVRRGDVFVAIKGARADGHDFVEEAIARGAAAVVAERALPIDVPQCVVSDAREALGQISQALAGDPSQSIKVIGVTGTNGKTTTAHLVASVLEAAGLRTGLLGTLGYHDSASSEVAQWTTPPAPVLADWLGRMQAHGCSHAVVEVSSHAISQRRIAGIEFSHVCLTNLGRDHLDYHGTLADYHHAKTSLFSHLGSSGMAVVNVDDAASMAAAPLLPGAVLTIGMERPADITARVVERSKSEQTFLITAGRVALPVRTAMIGDHHVYNCLCAAAIGLAEGIDLLSIVRGLETLGHVPGRLERIECGQPFGVYVDFAHTSDALAVALSAVREVTSGRVLCVFGAGGNRDCKKRPLMGRAVESLADVAIVTTDNPRFEDPRTIAAEILSGFERPGDARWMPERSLAIEYALSLAGPDDSVLIAGRGHETHQIVEDRRVPLDDRQMAREYLYNLASGSHYGALAGASHS